VFCLLRGFVLILFTLDTAFCFASGTLASPGASPSEPCRCGGRGGGPRRTLRSLRGRGGTGCEGATLTGDVSTPKPETRGGEADMDNSRGEAGTGGMEGSGKREEVKGRTDKGDASEDARGEAREDG